ncbi:hypothetical protein [Nocardia ignorata]|uniref:hypothetical protein n=1 Tax=Nocardia ignorata TaxID=145285 RepID=UPI0008357CA0|nr:hypothetical protein [Nocardia ignorata]
MADGRETIVGTRWDSYPECLGVSVVEFARAVHDWSRVRASAAALVHLDDETAEDLIIDSTPASEADVHRKRGWPDSFQPYDINQVCPSQLLADGCVWHLPNWPGTSIWCQWGYLFDLDQNVLEIYYGAPITRTAPAEGRFHDRISEWENDHPVEILATYSLSELPDRESFVRTLNDLADRRNQPDTERVG